MNSNNIKGQIINDDIEIREEKIYLPIEIEKYVNVINNNIILI